MFVVVKSHIDVSGVEFCNTNRLQEDFDFRCSGLAVHSGAGSQNATSVSTNVELLELPRKGPGERALSIWPSPNLRRPEKHGHVL